MKLYIFYRVLDPNKRTLDVPELYGFTDKKKIYKEFIEQRNMNVFHMIQRKVDNKFLEEFKKRYKHRELEYQSVYTRYEHNPLMKKKVQILTTWQEMDVIMLKTDMIFAELIRHVQPEVYYLKDKYIEALRDLYYLEACKFSNRIRFESPDFFAGLIDNSDGIVKSNLDYDEFALYMYFNGYTYK